MSQDDHAILIGIKSYPTLGENSTNADLQGPENDIAAVKEWLLDPKGGALHPSGATIHEVRAVAGASNRMGPDSETLEEDVLGKLEKLAETNPNGRRVGRRLYFYLSGHGFSPGRQRGCLYTPNATAKRGYNIHATGWLSLLQDSGYFSEYVLWMDCCMDRVTLLPPGEPRTRLMVSSESPRASFIAFAARRSLKAVEMPIGVGGAYHGLFTATLLDGLRGAAADSNGKVTGHSLADWIRNAMSARMTESELNDVDISKEPEVVQEDKSLVFVRGVTKPSVSIEVSFPANAAGETARLWSGSVPRVVREWQIGSAPEPLSIQAGLHLIDVPGAGLRQGFEIVHPTNIQISDKGPPAKDVAPGTIFQLEVDPGDPTAEIYVVDDHFALADNGAGRLSVPLSFGLYKIKTLNGRARNQQVILLDQDRPGVRAQEIVAEVPTVIPIQGTAASHEYQAESRRIALGKLAAPADGAALFLMARAFSGVGGAASETRPWQGVRIVDANGTKVIDLEKDGERVARAGDGSPWDPYAICTRQVTPGVYYLRQKLEDGTSIEQSLIVCPGWRHEVYVLRRAAQDGAKLDLRPRVSMSMGRLNAANDDYQTRLAEIARTALADERRILNDQLEQLLMAKLENPIAGIIGGQLLLVEQERDANRDLRMLDEVVGNLQRLLGSEHPDVAALALRCSDQIPQASKLLGPPMFQRSWKLLVEGAQKRPSLIPAALWGRVQAQGALPPFLIWATDSEVKSSARQSLARSILRELRPTVEPGLAENLAGAVAKEFAPRALETIAAGAGVAFTRQMLRMAKARAASISVPPSALKALRRETL